MSPAKGEGLSLPGSNRLAPHWLRSVHQSQRQLRVLEAGETKGIRQSSKGQSDRMRRGRRRRREEGEGVKETLPAGNGAKKPPEEVIKYQQQIEEILM